MDDEFEVAAYVCIIAVYFICERALTYLDVDRAPSINCDVERNRYLERLYTNSDRQCHNMLRMNTIAFHRLCERLVLKGLSPSRWVGVKEQVAMFLFVLGHDTKIRQGAFDVIRSSETYHRHFHNVLRAVLKLGKEVVRPARANYSPNMGSRTQPWAMRYFQNCVGAIDGTHIPALVPIEEQDAYRNRKGDISHNVLMACSFDMKITYVLAGWEGSAHDSRLLRAAVTHSSDKLTVPEGKYYLGDAGFPHVKGFLIPYRGTRYHLSEHTRIPATYKELYNYRHSSLRNVIERTFGLLKKRFAYLRHAPFYSVDTQIKLIIACSILHNIIRDEDPSDIGQEWPDLPEDGNDVGTQGQDITAMRSSDEWTGFRENLAQTMWNDYDYRHP